MSHVAGNVLKMNYVEYLPMLNLANWKTVSPHSYPSDVQYSDQFTKEIATHNKWKQKEQRTSYDYCFLKASQLQNITKASAKNTNHKTKCPNHKGLCQAKKSTEATNSNR